MDFIRGQNTLYSSRDWFQNMITGPLSYRGFRETGPRSLWYKASSTHVYFSKVRSSRTKLITKRRHWFYYLFQCHSFAAQYCSFCLFTSHIILLLNIRWYQLTTLSTIYAQASGNDHMGTMLIGFILSYKKMLYLGNWYWTFHCQSPAQKLSSKT